jgi:uncharacterized protein YhjY with autotransporter beta-barrel domain
MKRAELGKILSVACVLASAAPHALADLTNPTILSQLQPLEQRAAVANQSVYNQLISSGTCSEQSRVPSGSCTSPIFLIFENVRELVHTSNELTGTGPTQFSLGLDIENLGFALRWTAAEELAAQGAAATQFSNNQIGTLANQLYALRFGARGFRAVGRGAQDDSVRTARMPQALGGGATADEEGIGIASRWGGFIDGSFGYGNRDDTTYVEGYEDAFDFDGQEITAGVDYRFNNAFVLGVIAGYTDKAIDFDSSLSIVDATIDTDGYGVIVYALWEMENLYLSGSIGGQWLSHDLVRRITYPSFNPLVAPVDETARSNTDSSAITATFGLGYAARWDAFTLEPYLALEYQDITVDGFTESGAHGFDFQYGEQDIKSFEAGVGLKLQYAFTPSFGVIIPYLRGEYRKEFEDDSRDISAVYSGIASLDSTTGSEDFLLPTDKPDGNYYIVTGGFSMVLKHGVQGFIQYSQVFDLDHFTDHVITGGVRLEF